MTRKKPENSAAERAVIMAEYAADALIAAEQRRIKTKPLARLPLDDAERAVISSVPGLADKLRRKLAKADAAFSIAEVASITLVAAECLTGAEPLQQTVPFAIGEKLTDCLYRSISGNRSPVSEEWGTCCA